MESVRHRVGLIGAGHISPYHAAALRRIPGVELAGIYDADSKRSESLAAKLGTRAVSTVDALAREGADVIHVLTPPETHAQLALAAIDLGAHVLVEKPLATDVHDCERIASAARKNGLQVCVDHSLLYDLQIRRAIDEVRSGGIGRVISVDILRGAEYPPYEGGPLPPQYRSAGYPFRDLGIHQLYLLTAFLGPIEDVCADWYSVGGDPNLTFDEWRAEVRCRDGRGHVQISFNARPLANTIIVQGTKGTLRVEQMSMYSTRRASTALPKAAERVINAYGESWQSFAGVSSGAAGFLRKTLRQYDGVQRLIAEFYRTLNEGLPAPVTPEDAMPIVYWVERVARAADAEASFQARVDTRTETPVPVLVTGAAGALGGAIVDRLCARGVRLRVFVRRRAAREMQEGIEIATGDLGDPQAVDDAIRGAEVVVHAGAATSGSSIEQHTSTVVGTRNVIEACLRNGVRQLIYISSMSVVDWAGARRGEPITESSPLEPRPELRGAYTQSKLEAEMLVRRAVEEEGLRAVILRPGQIFGGKLPLVNAAVAREIFGRRIVLGDGNLRLPLVYIDDVVDAVCAAMDRHLAGGEIVQLVDSNLPTQNEILRAALSARVKIVRVPRAAVFTLGWLSEIALKPLRRASPISRYRLRSALARRTYAGGNAERLLNWKPRVGVYAGIQTVLDPAAHGERVRQVYAPTSA
jgi:predicted dehydrogenase/nucleoside-diphosphate-sugar epimerase